MEKGKRGQKLFRLYREKNKMKVLIINGSPRVNGNTATAIAEMEKIFAQEGIETEILQIGSKDIRGCIACGSCVHNIGRVGRAESNILAVIHTASSVTEL